MHTLTLEAVHTCPLWEEADGTRCVGMEEDHEHGAMVGWVNVLVLTIQDEQHHLLAVHQ